ncbi:MAG TPA: hypothetical protein VNQ99_09555 [Xanthobacteraceae bacterium]|nr:hypothetical protein [Xanthobacteraceae bacterium]
MISRMGDGDSSQLERPLVVDVDRTLLRTDILFETFVQVVFRRPWLIVLVPIWLLQGKAKLKCELARRSGLSIDTLPANLSLVEWLWGEKKRGRPVVLASAADSMLVEQVSRRFSGLFDAVSGSRDGVNLSRQRKLDKIRQAYGDHFTYVADGYHDLVLWRACRSAVLVGEVDRLRAKLPSDVHVEAVFPTERAGIRDWLRAVRLHQWAKNLLIFVPLLLSGNYLVWIENVYSIGAFVSFSLLASAFYLFNDLMDLNADRAHAKKHNRPLASGKIPLIEGLVAIPILVGRLTCCCFLGRPQFGLPPCGSRLRCVDGAVFAMDQKSRRSRFVFARIFIHDANHRRHCRGQY